MILNFTIRMRSILFVSIMAIMSSCCSSRHLNTSLKDSIRVEIRTRTEYVRDTIVREIPAISEKITTRDTASYLENYYAKSHALINQDGTLFHSLSSKPQKESIPIVRPVEYRDSIVYKDRLIRDIVEVDRELSWWQSMQIKGFWLAILVIAVSCRKGIFAFVRRFI